MNTSTLKQFVPWRARIAAKLLLSRLPVSFSMWRRLRLFQHGRMHHAGYVWFVFERHLPDFLEDGALNGKRLLELGPGDGIASGLLASCLGARSSVLVDAGDFAGKDVSTYEHMIDDWEQRGLRVDHLRGHTDFEALCAAGRTTYLTEGLSSLRSLPDRSIDIQVSNAVLEHVRIDELDATFAELARTLSPSGFGRHAVDLKDHLGGALNSLRFSDRLWESAFFAGSGFYTNRVRKSEMLARLANAGFQVDVPREWRWDRLPTPRRALAPRFRHHSDEELCVWGFDVHVRPGVPTSAVTHDVVPAALPATPATSAVTRSQRTGG